MMLPVNRAVITKLLVPNSILRGSTRSYSKNGNEKKNNDPLLPNAPGWDEKNATDSEADVKADHDPDDIDAIKKKTTEKFKNKPK